ncbi:hypothetical protein BD324DRAFT_617509 [Kockovaella imperatae]|uniref:Uncharacterized protein n=1 Tax=Kockovaella imperatae TaxID=4999 RepID=A0A1Y1ULI1_9TREE|nr:hypothetical protein BD324DRAFT_617509 [Kockovaella imperatae]ORX38839.1 hypothetical protein BD324DRAFT_617509 [Kockovaella imperatae]
MRPEGLKPLLTLFIQPLTMLLRKMISLWSACAFISQGWTKSLGDGYTQIGAGPLNISISQPGVPFAPSPLPPSSAASDPDGLAAAFLNLGRTTQWDLISAVQLQGDTWEPEGMVKLGDDRIIISAGEYTAPTIPFGRDANGTPIIRNGTDRANGAGFAHLILFNSTDGTRIADATLTERGSQEYHNGGCDYDGQWIWCTIAQYRPNSTATLVKVDPMTLKPTPVARIADHEGGVIHDTRTDHLVTLNWGSRNASTWSSRRQYSLEGFSRPVKVVRNPSYFVDYQDCKFVGYPSCLGSKSIALCSGVATIGSGNSSYNLGGIALVDTETMDPLVEVPIAWPAK